MEQPLNYSKSTATFFSSFIIIYFFKSHFFQMEILLLLFINHTICAIIIIIAEYYKGKTHFESKNSQSILTSNHDQKLHFTGTGCQMCFQNASKI